MKKFPKVSLVPDEMRESLDFLGYIYCPGKEAFSENILDFIEKRKKEGKDIKGIVPMGSCSKDEYFNVNKIKDINKFPSVLTSCGFTEFFEEEFMSEFVDKGYFERIQNRDEVNKTFKELKLEDPKNTYNIYAAFPYIMLIDRRKLNERKLPSRWSDVLGEEYENSIAVGHTYDDINEIVLLYIYKNFGEKGIKALARNINVPMGTIEMAKYAAEAQNSEIAIYILPYFFAKAAPKREYIKIVWPEEGGFLCPLYVISKKHKNKYMNEFVEYLYSYELGQSIADKYFPHVNRKVNNKIDNNGQLQWLGWDFIYEKNIISRIEEIEEIFYKELKSIGKSFPKK